jgi:hypothetical protein
MTAAASQTEMRFTGREARVSAERVQELCKALADGNWHTARQLAPLGFDDRELRHIRMLAREQFVTGSRGYKLARFCTAEEFRECLGRARSQVREMQATIVALTNLYHRALHAPRRETLPALAAPLKP